MNCPVMSVVLLASFCVLNGGKNANSLRSSMTGGLSPTLGFISLGKDMLVAGGVPARAVRCFKSDAGSSNTAASALRKPVLGGNWKCNGSIESAVKISEMLNQSPLESKQVEVVIAPPSLHVAFLQSSLKMPFSIATQDSSANEGYGAFTGEISPKMVKDFGVDYVIVGHSERRAGFGGQPGESNQVVAKKARAALNQGLRCIACIGESLDDRQAGKTMDKLSEQLDAFNSVLTPEDWLQVVLAYEPIWAIGTGKTATPEMAQQTHAEIRGWLRNRVSSSAGDQIRIIYGGSVKGSNSRELYQQEDIDGFLVGGASLTDDFHAILKAAASPKP